MQSNSNDVIKCFRRV